MPKKDFVILLNSGTRIFVYFFTNKKKVVQFVVKSQIFENNEWKEIERYDCYHGFVHKDIFDKNSNKKRVIKYELMANEAGLNMALKDFKENHEIYIWRYHNV